MSAADRVLSLGEPPVGVLRVHAVSLDAGAFVTDLWTLGSAKDLGALGWPVARRVDFVRRVAEALEALHRAGIVHGCLCEENVLLDDDLAPVLAEAGAVSVHALSERGGDSASYVAFAAPEILDGTGGDGDARSDVFSIGRLLQHVLRADTVPQAVDVIRRCVAPAPAGRYATAAEAAKAIEGLIAAIGVEMKPAAPPPRTASETKAAPESAAATFSGAPPAASLAPMAMPSWLGPLGGGMVVLSVVAASFGVGSTTSMQTALEVVLVAGVAMAATTLRPAPRTPLSLRVTFALAAAALVAVGDPLAYAYRSAAERAVRASPAARRAAVEQIIRLGRDFQNMSLAGVDLSGTDLRGADLRGADLSRSDLSHADLAGAMLAGASLAEAKLAAADLRQTDLERAHFESAACDPHTMLPPPLHCDSGLLSDAPELRPAAAPAKPPPQELEGGAAPR
jgi:hypothetical protein